MSDTLQVIRVRDSLPLSRLTVDTPDPLVLLGQGTGLMSTESALVNGHDASFEVISDTRILITVPTVLKRELIRSVDLLSERYTGKNGIRLEFAATGRLLSGLQKLVQQFVLLMFTTPGSDTFAKGVGGGIQSLSGVSMDAKGRGAIVALIQSAVRRTASQLTTIQASLKLPADERIKHAELLDVRFDSQRLAVAPVVGLESVAGLRAVTRIED